jgi:hypothetical protein
MALPAKSLNIRWNKYALLNVLVLIAMLGMLIAVLVWYERRVQRIENEMKKQGLAVVKRNSIVKHCFFRNDKQSISVCTFSI